MLKWSWERGVICKWRDFGEALVLKQSGIIRSETTGEQTPNKQASATNSNQLETADALLSKWWSRAANTFQTPRITANPSFSEHLASKIHSLTCGKDIFWDDDLNMTALINCKRRYIKANETCHLMYHVWIWTYSFWCYEIKYTINTGPSLSYDVFALINLGV